jgi:transposase-like protein
VEDALAPLRLAVGVALLAEAGYSRAEIARRTGASPAALKDAWDRLERIAPDIDRELPTVLTQTALALCARS